MKIIKNLLIIFTFGLVLFTTNVFAEGKNEVTLNFSDGIIHDGYVEYSKIGKLQLFKDDQLVTNISNDMTVDLNEAEYKFVIEEIEDTESVVGTIPVKLSINSSYYPMTTIEGETRSTFKLDSSKFSGVLNVKLVRTGVAINTKVENVYNDITSTGIINLDNNSFVIDFSKNDELTNGLKLFADLEKTLYYKDVNGGLIETDNESEAIIKIVGNKQANKAILTVINTGDKIKQFKGLRTKYTGSKLQYIGTENNIINEIRTDYYTRCNYNFTFNIKKNYKFIEGENQIYVINKTGIMRFRIDADYSLFENGGKVYIDDVLVDSSNYTSESGSTIITFKKSFADKLTKGEHTLKVVFNDGGVAVTKFIINANLIENPNTGDNIISYVIVSVLSLLGLIGTGIYKLKKQS